MDTVLVKDDVLRDWAKGGQAAVLRLLADADGVTAEGVPTRTALTCELCRAVLRGALSEADAAALFASDALGTDAERTDTLRATLADALWYLGVEAEGSADGRKPRLVQLVRACVDGGALPAALLKETLEVELLAAADLVPSAEAFKRREARARGRAARAARHPPTRRHSPRPRPQPRAYRAGAHRALTSVPPCGAPRAPLASRRSSRARARRAPRAARRAD